MALKKLRNADAFSEFTREAALLLYVTVLDLRRTRKEERKVRGRGRGGEAT